MVRNYKRKTDRDSYGDTALNGALRAIENGMPLKRASRDYGVPAHTLRRHRYNRVVNPGHVLLGGHNTALPAQVEREIHDHIIRMEKHLYGSTPTDIRKLAYEVVIKANIPHCFNVEKAMAGKDWLSGFLSCNPDLSVRSPQAINLSRAEAFNRTAVENFFQIYRTLLNKESFEATDIWNVDETGLSTVQKPARIVASKGVRQVSKVTSRERGITVTAVCAVSASGTYMPPMFIYPRKRIPQAMMTNAPPASIAYGSSNGWIDSELFLKWLEHFCAFTKASKDRPQLIILDGHHSHKTLAAIELAESKGVHLLTLPPHSTHRMQPLDRTFFRPLKTA